MTNNRPQGHVRKPTGTASVGQRRGEGLGTGPVGNTSRPSGGGGGAGGGFGGGRPPRQGGHRPQRSSSDGERGILGGGKSPLIILVAVAVLLFGGGGALGGLFNCGSGMDLSGAVSGSGSGFGSGGSGLGSILTSALPALLGSGSLLGGGQSTPSYDTGGILSSLGGLNLLGAGTGSQSTSVSLPFSTASAQYSGTGDTMTVNRNVVAGAAAKRTQIKGGGKDKVTMMVYMCGTDLESRSGMASNDLNEMMKASFGDNVNIIVYTGGCAGWKTRNISNTTNQIWRVTPGKMTLLDSDGSKVMTDPATLSGFIRYCEKNFPSNRRFLILWDHGGGSVSGFGYDEKNRNSGSMSLPGIQKALRDGGVKFDFIGFDACLMATVETALMTSEYADYLIASEETEPGVGWFYTTWLNELGKNTSISTLDLGKSICDSFVSACSSQARGQRTTLSVVDLSELAYTMPDALTAFSSSITDMVRKNDYKKVSVARNGCREFAASTRIDQVDLADLADRLGTDEAKALAEVVRSAVKYNRAGSLTGAYGLSMYFPYRQPAKATKAAASANSIGMDDSYSECIRAFAAVEQAGQGSMAYAQQYAGTSSGSMTDLLSLFLGGRALNGDEAIVQYLSDNALSPEDLHLSNQNGVPVLRMSADKWSLVTAVDLNVIYLDGTGGYIDLGTDNVFEWIDDVTLKGDTSGAWIALNGKVAAYYREYQDASVTYGYIPILLNGERAELLVTRVNGEYSVTGARRVYKDGETETVAKADTEITEGSTIELICDYYNAAGVYQDSYRFSSPITCNGIAGLTVTEVSVDGRENFRCTYRLTDIYEQEWWTDTYTLQ